MLNEIQWTTDRIAEARRHHASVTEAVAVRIAELLTGQLIERQLSPTELAKVASVLIGDMSPAPPKVDAKP